MLINLLQDSSCGSVETPRYLKALKMFAAPYDSLLSLILAAILQLSAAQKCVLIDSLQDVVSWYKIRHNGTQKNVRAS